MRDRELIAEILHLDDGSSPRELEEMRLPSGDFALHAIYRCIDNIRISNRGHRAHMRQAWHDLVSPADYVFHCEDDLEFTQGGNLVGDAIKLMEANPHIGQAGLWRKLLSSVLKSHNGISYWKWPHDPAASFVRRLMGEDEIDRSWPHFSLRPGMVRCEALRRTENFQLERFFEHAFAKRWTAAGFTSAFLGAKYCRHLAPGIGQSVYERDGTIR